MSSTKKYYEIDETVAHKGTNENSHVINICKIIGFDGIALHVKNENGTKYFINTWDLCNVPEFTTE